MADQAPLPERLAELRQLIASQPSTPVEATRLLVKLAKSMLSEAELAALPEAERLVLYRGIEGAIARLKQYLQTPDPGPAAPQA